MKFLELTMKNFRSYGNNVTTIKLDFENPTLIIGRNYDDVVDGQVDSNGAGKTTILDAISVCCYDKTISGIDKGDMINYVNGKNMEISVTFEKNNMFYKIVRYRANKALGGDGVKLFINSECVFNAEHDKTLDSINNTTKEIERIIGIPFEIFSRIVIFSASYEPFLNLPFSHASKENQKDVFEELFGLTELTRKAELLKISISETKKTMVNISRDNELFEQELSRYEDHLAQTEHKKTLWDVDNKDSIKQIKNELKPLIKIDLDNLGQHLKEIESLSNKKKEIEKEIQLIRQEINRIDTTNKKYNIWEQEKINSIKSLSENIDKLSKIDVEHFKTLETELRDARQQLKLLSNAIDIKTQDKKTLERKIKDLISEKQSLDNGECPYCHQTYKDNQHKIEECDESLINSQKILDEIIFDLKQLNEERQRYETIISEIPSIPPNLDNIANDLIKFNTELTLVNESSNPYELEDTFLFETTIMDKQTYLIELDNSKDKILQNIETDISVLNNLGYDLTISSLQRIERDIELKANKLESLQESSNPYTEMIGEIKQMIEDVKKKILIDEIDDLNTTLEHQNFLLKLLTKKDSFVRKALLNKNIPFLNGRMSYYLKKIGLTHKVEFDEEMAVQISKFGTQYKYKALSSGQRARINLALVFSFRDVLQARFDKINFYILDECLDVGLGNVGVQLATKMIKNVALENDISMFVISHRDEISSMFSNKLEIELRNGFSNVKE